MIMIFMVISNILNNKGNLYKAQLLIIVIKIPLSLIIIQKTLIRKVKYIIQTIQIKAIIIKKYIIQKVIKVHIEGKIRIKVKVEVEAEVVVEVIQIKISIINIKRKVIRVEKLNCIIVQMIIMRVIKMKQTQ